MQDADRTLWFNIGKLAVAGGMAFGYYIILGIGMVTISTVAGTNFALAGLAAIGPVIGAVMSNMYPKGNDQDKDTIAELTKKVAPVTVPASDLTVNQPGGKDAVSTSQ